MKKTTILISIIVILVCILIKVYSPTKNIKIFNVKDSLTVLVDTILLDSTNTIDSIHLDTL